MLRRSRNGEFKEDMAPLEKAEGGFFAKGLSLAHAEKFPLYPESFPAGGAYKSLRKFGNGRRDT